MTTSSTTIAPINTGAQTAATPAGALKLPFVPPTLTKHGSVAAITQDFGGSCDPQEPNCE